MQTRETNLSARTQEKENPNNAARGMIWVLRLKSHLSIVLLIFKIATVRGNRQKPLNRSPRFDLNSVRACL